jgi:hypothetical protein
MTFEAYIEELKKLFEAHPGQFTILPEAIAEAERRITEELAKRDGTEAH